MGPKSIDLGANDDVTSQIEWQNFDCSQVFLENFLVLQDTLSQIIYREWFVGVMYIHTAYGVSEFFRHDTEVR